MMMGSSLYTFQIATVVSLMWRPSHTVVQIDCDATINLNPLTAETYRFGNLTHTYPTLHSCTFNFVLSDTNENLAFQITPRCTAEADELKINTDENLCCDGCTKPVRTTLGTVSFTSDSNTEQNEYGFDITVVTGKEQSACVDSSNTSVTVGTSPVIITSPNFPAKYPKNKECGFIISSQDSNKGLSLTLEVISLDNDNAGCFDFILLGLDNAATVKMCAGFTDRLSLPGSSYTSKGEIYLKFKSDGELQGNGFRVKIIQVDLGATEAPTAASTTLAQTTETTTTTASPTAETTETTSKITQTSETTAVPTTVQSASPTISASAAESTSVESTAAPNTDPTTETIESNETTQDSTTTTTSMRTKPEEAVSSSEVPSTTASPTTSPQPTTTGFFDGLTTTAQVVALTGLVFLGVTPICVILIFCLNKSKKRKKSSRDNQSQNSFFQKDDQYVMYNPYPMTHKPLFYKYWAEL